MIDRDSYASGQRGEAAFLLDARALLSAVHAYGELDLALEVSAGSDDAQRLVDGARRGMAASALDEIGAACELLADVAREFGAPIEAELRAARRLLDMTYEEARSRDLPRLRPVQATLFDPTDIPEFTAWRHEKAPHQDHATIRRPNRLVCMTASLPPRSFD